MKILLFGEYNRAHRFLKEALVDLNHEATVISRKDAFKEVDIDICLEPSVFNKKIPHYIRRLLITLLNFDIVDLFVCYKFYKNRSQLINNDVVQLINEFPLHIHPFLEKKCLAFLFKNNSNVYLSSCGDDYTFVNYILSGDIPYHLMTPYLEKRASKKDYEFNFEILKKSRETLHEFVFSHIKKVIPADFDYVMAYRHHKKATQLIPHPINISKFKYQTPILGDEIIIFHGINRANYYRKGNYIFEEALEIIIKKHPKKVKVITVENRPYNEYIKLFDKANILLDQVFAYDQGYNALEAMAKGKVVFTGAENEWLEHYNLKEDKVAINALPNAKKIAEKLEWLILNPTHIIEIGKNARRFVESHHNHVNIAKEYLSIWKS